MNPPNARFPRDAACRNYPTDWWFSDPFSRDPSERELHQKALKVCGLCPVRVECAKEGHDQPGLWGGQFRGQKKPTRNVCLASIGVRGAVKCSRYQCGGRHRRRARAACLKRMRWMVLRGNGAADCGPADVHRGIHKHAGFRHLISTGQEADNRCNAPFPAAIEDT